MDTLNTHDWSLNTHDDWSLSWLVTCTKVESSRIKLVLWAQASLLSKVMWSCKYLPHVSKMPTSYNRMSSFVEKAGSLSWTLYIMYFFFMTQKLLISVAPWIISPFWQHHYYFLLSEIKVSLNRNGTWQKYTGDLGWLFKIKMRLELRFDQRESDVNLH
jgi:hypothetical protein